jgi:hypothetical protein
MSVQLSAVSLMPSSSQTRSQKFTVSHGAYNPDPRPLLSNLPLYSFPGQEHVVGSYKIPTIMYYDQEGNMKAGGAETEGSAMMDLAEDYGWTKAELCALSSSYNLMIFNALTIDSSFDSGPKL